MSLELKYHRHPNIFHGYCYACNNYGHKAIHCRAHERNILIINRDMNSFKFQCFNCQCLGHMAKYCKMTYTKVWRKKYVVNIKNFI